MSSPTIRISDMSAPEISAVQDVGQTLEITNLDDFDLGLLGNQRKMAGTPPRSQSPGLAAAQPIAADSIEFVNLEDTAVSFDIKPPATTNDTIRIMRDNSPPQRISFDTAPPAVAPTASAAPKPSSGGWFSSPPAPAAPAANSSGVGGMFKGWFGGSSAPAQPTADPNLPTMETYLSPEEEAAKKSDMLTQLERLDRKGVGGTKMTVANSLEEIKAELNRRKDATGLEASLRFQRSMMTTVTSGMEFLNSRYDPFGVHLDGWSEQVSQNIEDYDEIFEELYDKYKDKSKVAPEVRLIMSLGLSAAMCHVTNTMFKSRAPGMDEILRKNPGLAQQFAQAAANEVGPGFGNFMSMGASSGGGRRGDATPPMGGMGGIGGFMSSMMGGGGAPVPPSPPPESATARRPMRGPTGVDDILNQLNANNIPTRAMPRPASVDGEEGGSVMSGMTGMTTETMRRNGMSRRRKATTAQPTGGTLTLNV
jgi:hypothetical protein